MIKTKTCNIVGIGNFTIPENEPNHVWSEWELPTKEYILKNIKKGEGESGGGHFIDVGANIGYFSVWASTKAEKVYSIEPNPDVYILLERNSKLGRNIDGSNNIKTFNMALSDVRKIGKIYYRNFAGGDGRLYDPRDGNDHMTRGVVIDTLSGFQEIYCSGHGIDMIKMDCEGSEHEILKDLDFFKKEKNKNCEVVLELHGPMIQERGLDFNKFLEYLLLNFDIKDLFGNVLSNVGNIQPRGFVSLKYKGRLG